MCLYGVGKLLQRLRAHIDARLILAPLQQIDWQLRELLATGRGLENNRGGRVRRGPGRLPQQISETAAQRGLLLSHGCGS